MIFSPTQRNLEYVADQTSIKHTHDDFVCPGDAKPVCHGFARAPGLPQPTIMGVSNQVQRNEEERVSQAIVRSRLGYDDSLQLLRNMLVGELALHDRSRENGISWGNT